MKNILILSIFMFCFASVFAQAGAKIYGGLTTGFNQDKNVTPSGTTHSGWVAGIDARLNDDRMYFLFGVLYGVADLNAQSSPTFFTGDKMSFIKGRVGLGFDMVRISPKFFITSKFAGSIKYLSKYDKTLLTNEGYEVLNDGTAGVVGGLGVRMGIINIDLEYEHGLFNLYNKKTNSNMHYITLTTGVNF